jgi:hypothetical protein
MNIIRSVLPNGRNGLKKSKNILQDELKIDIESYETVSSLISDLQKHITTTNTVKINARDLLNKINSDPSYQEILTFIGYTNKNKMDGLKEINSLIKNLEDVKTNLRKGKAGLSNEAEGKDTIDKLNKAQANTLEIQTALNELVSIYCIPASKLCEVAIRKLNIAMDQVLLSLGRPLERK